MDDVSGCFEYYAKLAEKLDESDETPITDIPDDYKEQFSANTRRIPVGVVAAIVPWNYPLLMAAWKIAPALAAGCTLILKPSEVTPLTALELADIIDKENCLPKGVFNVVIGTGPGVGQPLSEHAGVAKVGFTGSVATGRAILRASANSPQIKNVSLELGGKSPFIVCEDVDIEEAAEWVAFGVFWTNGQICSSTSRLLIHEKVADAVLKRVAQIAESIHLGDPFTEKDPSMGPLVNYSQQQKALSYIDSAKREGATVFCGGGNLEGSKGYYVQPTVLTDVTPAMRVWNEEIFGPVLSVITFRDEKEAVELANRNDYGLAAAVMSRQKEELHRIARQLRAGIVWLNCSQPAFVQVCWCCGVSLVISCSHFCSLFTDGVGRFEELRERHTGPRSVRTGPVLREAGDDRVFRRSGGVGLVYQRARVEVVNNRKKYRA
jgi:betaine-aldehyde dehydrogenase